MDRQMLPDWIHRYDDEGLSGLSNHTSTGPTPLLNGTQKAEFATWVEDGPDPEADGVVRWRCVDLKHKVKECFGVEMHERTIGMQLAALGFRRLSVRSQHPRADDDAQAALKKLRRQSSGNSASDGEGQEVGNLVSGLRRIRK